MKKALVGVVLLLVGFSIGFMDIVLFPSLEISQLAGLAGALGMSTVVLSNKLLGTVLSMIGGFMISTKLLMVLGVSVLAVLMFL